MDRFPALVDWTATRDTLHAYSRVAGAIQRKHADSVPDWSHVGLVLADNGLVTRPFSTRRGEVALELDLQRHRLELSAPGGVASISLDGGLSGSELADELIRRGEALGVRLQPEPGYYENDRPTGYHTAKAEAYLGALHDIDAVFSAVQAELAGDVTETRFWPHHFDLSFEWRGKDVTYQAADGSEKAARASIGFGFSTGDSGHGAPYLYANPFPFEPELVDRPLPAHASWYTDAWNGSLLPYASVAESGEQLLYDYFVTVFQEAAPSLSA
jgi:hypothetical protein